MIIMIGSIGDNSPVTIGHGAVQHTRAGDEGLAHALEWVLGKVDQMAAEGLSAAELRAQIAELRAEVSKPQPDPTVTARGLETVRRMLTPVAAGLAKVANAQTIELANDLIDRLAPWS